MAAGDWVKRVTVNIPDWLYYVAVWTLLLSRRLRFGCAFRRIELTRGKFAIVDPADYDRLAQHKWHALRTINGHHYAVRNIYNKHTRKKTAVHMHRQIINVPHGLFVDHINGNPLDNRSANLRPATPAQNRQNASSPRIKTTSRYKGVYFHKNKYYAAICKNQRKIHLGVFTDEIDAAKAYDTAARKYHGEFAYPNFPNE